MSEKNFKPVVSGDVGAELVFIRPSQLEEPGVLVEGEFVEALQNRYNEELYDYKFKGDEGNVVVINHAGHLAYQMREVSVGDYCRVTYNGKTTYKGRESHNFLVETAD